MSREHFAAEWLSLREPVDHRSRAAELVSLLANRNRREPLRVLDLGAGTGSNLRYLAPRMPGPQDWTLVDHDQRLLDAATGLDTVDRVNRVRADLSDLSCLDIAGADVVTGSALLDLVSEDWLRLLVDECRRGSSRALFALTYDGSIDWRTPAHDRDIHESDDELVREMANRHQRQDKGFGPALGPLAGAVAHTLFQQAGYRTWLVPSPWLLTRGDAELASTLVEGWESAASSPGLGAEGVEVDRVRTWASRRLNGIAAGDFELCVGHVDLLAMPA